MTFPASLIIPDEKNYLFNRAYIPNAVMIAPEILLIHAM